MLAAKRQVVAVVSKGAVGQAALVISLPASAKLSVLVAGSPEFAWLAWFALIPLFVVIRCWRPVGGLFGGALWGIALYGFGGGRPEVGMTAGLSTLLLLTIAPAVYAFLGAYLTRRIGFVPFVLGVGWTGVELALHGAGFRTGLLGAVQGEASVLHWVAATFGFVLVAFLIASVNALLVSVLNAAYEAIPRRFHLVRSEDRARILSPQTIFCFPFSAVRPLRPRAPPIPAATVL